MGLLFMAAEQSEKEDSSHLERVQIYKEQLNSVIFLKPGYMKAYYRNVSLKLAKDMKDLKTGLQRHGAQIAMTPTQVEKIGIERQLAQSSK